MINYQFFQTFLNYDETMVPEKRGDKEDKMDKKEEKEKVDNKANGVTSDNVETLKTQAKETIDVLQKCEGYMQGQLCDDKGIILKNMYAKWIPEVSEDTLSNINLTVIPGKLTAVIGPVGAGKVKMCCKKLFIVDCL